MSDEPTSEKPKLRVPRPAALSPTEEPEGGSDFLDREAVLLLLETELEGADEAPTTENTLLDGTGWEAERDAALGLEEAGQVGSWQHRAEWFEQEAVRVESDLDRVRLLAVASELRALCGEFEQAEQLADRARRLDTQFSLRQARQLAYRRKDWTKVREILNEETETAASPTERAHAAFYAAELERLIAGSSAQCLRFLDQGLRFASSDPRASLFKLARQIGTSARPPSLKWPEAKDLAPLRDATALLGRLRGDRRYAETSTEPLLSFVQAQAALAKGKRGEAADALEGLFSEPGLGIAARWLAASLYAPDAQTREQSVECLTELLELSPTSSVRRSLAERSLEAGRADAAHRALSDADDPTELAFTGSERVAIGALTFAPLDEMRPWLEQASEDPDGRWTCWAIFYALGELPNIEHPGSEAERARLRVCNLLALGQLDRLKEELPSLREHLADHALSLLLELESAYQAGDANKVARMLRDSMATDPEAQAAASYVSGVLLERAGRLEDASASYRAALDSSPFGEAAFRALQALEPSSFTRPRLLELIDRGADAERKLFLLLEAALPTLVGAPDDTARGALDRLRELPVETRRFNPLVRLLLERDAFRRTDGNDAERAALLSDTLEAGSPPFELAWIRARQAALDGALARQNKWLTEALEALPAEATLIWLQEELDPPELMQSARFREALARTASHAARKGRLLLQASLYYEVAGAFSEATRTAREAGALTGSELGQHAFTRNALRSLDVDSLKERWIGELESATAEDKLDRVLKLSSLERSLENPDAEFQWLEEAHRLAPERLDVLVLLEYLAVCSEQRDALLWIETDLSERLSKTEAVPHSLLAARLLKVKKGWPAAHPMLKRADAGEETPLYTLRQLQAHARRTGDDAAVRDLSIRLARRVTNPADRSTLLLRAAEAALRLKDKALAKEASQQAAELTPGHLFVQDFVANLWEEEDPIRAATAYERFAQQSRVASHRVDAWYKAACLWSDRAAEDERAVTALQRAAELDPSHSDVFARLSRLLQAKNDTEGLCRAIEQRLSVAATKEERSELGLRWAHLLRNAGEPGRARSVLKRLLDDQPDHLPALFELTDLALGDAQPEQAEEALLSLVRLTPDPKQQAEGYLQLGRLYMGPLRNPERARRSFQEVLRRQPEDAEARAALLPLYLQEGDPSQAKQHFEETLEGLSDDAQRRSAFLSYLEQIHEHLADPRPMNELVERALIQWPLDPEFLDIALRHYQKQDATERIRVLRAEVFSESARKLSAGLIEPRYLEATAALAQAAGDTAHAKWMQATAAAIGGSVLRLAPMGGQAMNRALDEKLAPSPVVSAFRTLLMLTRDVLERAFALPRFQAAQEPQDSPLVRRTHMIARQAAVPPPVVCSDTEYPDACWLHGAQPVQLVFGNRLLAQASPEELDFLIWRSIKLIQAKAGVFTRLDAEQAKIAALAFLSCFTDRAVPEDAHHDEVVRIQKQLKQLLKGAVDDDAPVLALEALESLTTSGEHLALAMRKWANRTALLATGNVHAAFSALTRITGETLAPRPPERSQTLSDNPETRDLITSASSDQIAEALNTKR